MPITFIPLARSLSVLLAAAMIAACAAPGDPGGPAGHRHRHADPQRGAMPGQAGAGQPHPAMEGMDMDRLCAMHRAMRDAPADQRQALQEQHMKGMSPAMRQQMIDMMLRQCH